MTNANLDLAELARSAGIPRANNVTTPEEFARAMSDRDGAGARVLVLSAKPDTEVVRPPIALDPVLTKQRFMSAIGAPRYVPTMFGGGRLEGK